MGIINNSEELDVILDNIYEAVCIVDSNYIVKHWNKAAEKLYGYKKSELYGCNIKERFPNALLVKTLDNKKAYRYKKHRPNDDSHVVISTSPIFVRGRLLGAISTDRDITEVEKLYNDLYKEQIRIEDLKAQIKDHNMGFDNIIGESYTTKNTIALAKQVSKTDASILLRGESGTGKDVFARAIHKESARTGDFIPVNSSAIPSSLMESELFGYEKGAFTGARKTGKLGKFELAHKGTIFLDEIGDMPFFMQAKLLRVLQDGIVYRVGGSQGKKIDVRVIAATNKNLEEMIRKGEFREDLYYRLNVMPIELKPLRERREDIVGLIDAFILEFSRKNSISNMEITDQALEILKNHSWKGNIRELRNVIERLVILSNENIIDTSYIPKDIILTSQTRIIEDVKEESLKLNEAVERLEKEMILLALRSEDSNKAKAARKLGIKRSTLYYKMNLYEIEDQ